MDESEQSKLFVGGISWETSNNTLKEHFKKYGTVVGCVIAKDRNTGSPRGFAFVSFADPSSVDGALLDTHNIHGRTVEVKKAIPRSEQNQNQQQSRDLSRNSRSNGRNSDQFRTKKIFVGGLSANLTEEEFKGYFEKFGRITDVVVMHDNITHRPRGFGFITFDSEDAVEDVMQMSFHELSGKYVEVKRAVPKEGNNSANTNGYNNVRVVSGNGSNINGYQNASYPTYSPRYGVLPGYGAHSGYGGVIGYPYGAGVLGVGYPTGVYGGIGYGVGPVAPRSPWNGPTMVGYQGSPMPYYYPPYMNGAGFMGVSVPNGYNGIVGNGPNGKSSQFGGAESQAMADDVAAQVVEENVDVDSYPAGDSS